MSRQTLFFLLLSGLILVNLPVFAQQLTPADTLRLLAHPQRAAHTFVHCQM